MISASDTPAGKAHLRAEALGRRRLMGAPARKAASAAAALRALAIMGVDAGRVEGRTVALFAAIRDEIDPSFLAEALRAQGASVALPVVLGPGRALIFRRWDAGDLLAPRGIYSIPTPAAEAPEVTPDLVLVPLAAFDRRGFRIGYGGGFYDRTLAGLRRHKAISTIGYAFACQEVPRVPAESHDVPVDLMVTESEAFSCAGR